jgi:hypothetical protein
MWTKGNEASLPGRITGVSSPACISNQKGLENMDKMPKTGESAGAPPWWPKSNPTDRPQHALHAQRGKKGTASSNLISQQDVPYIKVKRKTLIICIVRLRNIY